MNLAHKVHNVSLDKIKGYEFIATWWNPSLTQDEMLLLGLTEPVGELEIEGEYTVEYDYECMEPKISFVGFYAVSNNTWIHLDPDRVDYAYLEDRIATEANHSDWLSDRYME